MKVCGDERERDDFEVVIEMDPGSVPISGRNEVLYWAYKSFIPGFSNKGDPI